MPLARPLAALRELDRPLLVLAGIALIAQTGISIMLPLLPLYALELGAAPYQLALLTSVFALTNTIGQLGVGFVAQRIAPRRMLPAGSAFYAASNALIATAGSAVALIVYRGIAGLGGGVMLIAERLYLARITPADRMAYANGILSAAGSLGSVAGPVLGGGLAVADLRIPFIVVAVTSTIAALAATRLPKEPRNLEPEPVRPARVPAPDPAPADAAGPSPAPSAPALWRTLAPIFVVNLGMSATYGAWITTYGPLTTTRYGWSATDVAFVWACIGFGTIVLGPWLGRQADHRGRRPFGAIGIVMVMGWAALLLVELPKEIVYATAPLCGGGLTVAGAAFFALLAEATGGGRKGRAFGFITALSNLGLIVGAAVASVVWDSIDLVPAMATSIGFLAISLAALAFVREARTADVAPAA